MFGDVSKFPLPLSLSLPLSGKYYIRGADAPSSETIVETIVWKRGCIVLSSHPCIATGRQIPR